MGADGGVIATQRRFARIKVIKDDDKQAAGEKSETQNSQWSTCALSKLALTDPIVMCSLGYLFNKEAIVEALIKGDVLPDSPFAHIKKLKDVSEVHFEINPAYAAAEEDFKFGKISQVEFDEVAHFICPLSRREIKGPYAFSAIRTCGCVFGDRALKELPGPAGSSEATETLPCPRCSKPYLPTDVVPLYPGREKREEMRRQLSVRSKSKSKLKRDRSHDKEKGKGKKEKKEKVKVKRLRVAEAETDGAPSGSGVPSIFCKGDTAITGKGYNRLTR